MALSYPTDLPEPVLATGLDIVYRVRETVFGDGYRQTAPAGIQTKQVKCSVQYQGLTAEEKASLITFFDTLAGYQYFDWTPPGESTESTWRQVGSINIDTIGGGLFNVSTSYELVYGV